MLSNSIKGQTCCTAGAPIITGIGIQSAKEKSIDFKLRIEHRSINRLVENNRVLENDPRSRTGLSSIANVNYSLSEKFSVGVLLPLISQNRTTFSEEQSSFGIGDISILGSYKFWSHRNNSLYWISSIKLPTGSEMNLGARSIILSPDMQSGSGTLDFISQLSYLIDKIYGSRFSFQTSILYRYNTTNDNFGTVNGSSGRSFKFGNEFQWAIKLNHEFLLSEAFIVPDIELQYRFSDPNEEMRQNAPNSGGHWINGAFGIYILPQDNFNIRTYIQVPLFQSLEGLQITTNLQLGIEIGYSLNINNEQKILNDVIF